ncbi:MAG: hypothetical protein EZS28_046414 [Streblomastix strix]|uniref:Tyr recombinase domain-containing protein n=1 Tax=Streblomastix strix TaxID=222440 RepID=A0A5J4TJT3_9EUKA|nr:MAG: hypothetical protein EZS28_046414 [Streblomastix strix]
MAGFIGLDDDIIVNLIGSLSGEAWRKRRAGLYLFGEYVEERAAKGGVKAKEELRKMRTHAGMALGMFASSGNVLQAPVVVAVARNLELERGGNAKYPTVWNIGKLFNHIRETGLGKGRVLMRQAMALVVAFSGCRMTELAAMRRSDIQQMEDRTIIHTKIRKGKRVKEFNIRLLRRDDVCCAHGALKLWLMDSHCGKSEEGSIWWDFARNRALGSIGCSSELKELIVQAGVDDDFGGNTIRHSMMTKLRQEGASLEQVNEFTRHAPGSSVVDRFYNKPEKAEDLGNLLLKE